MKRAIVGCAFLAALILNPLAASAEPQNDVIGYWTHELQPGFNLVAFPVLPDTPSPQAVIGDRLGAVEISTWDPALAGWRSAQYDPETGAWSGNLFLLNRGVAYWINLMDAAEAQKLVVVGHPELYTKFTWSSLLIGRQFYAPTYGKTQALNDIPPEDQTDLLIAWDSHRRQFQLAEAGNQGWRSPSFQEFAPDHAYMVILHSQDIRQFGPPLAIQSQYERLYPESKPVSRDGANEFTSVPPPQPLIVGNIGGMAVCNPNGEACGGNLGVTVYREVVVGARPVSEMVTSYQVFPNAVLAGRFRFALAVGSGEGTVQVGDRVYLVARDGNGAETRSTSFEVPGDFRDVTDLSFNDPLSAGGVSTELPVEFSLGNPYPNPFNDRFMVDVRLPEVASVEISLYDIQGRLASRQSQPLSAGTHRLTMQGGNLAAGIYLMKVNAGGKQGLAKVAHVK